MEIPYLNHFYNTNTYLVGAPNDYIYALRGEKKEMVCVKIIWTPYNLTTLKEVLRNNQYLRLKGIKTFKEEGENIMDRLVSIEERRLPQDINYEEILDDVTRQRLYERRLKLTKAIPIMWREITLLEDENQDQISI